MHFWSRCYYLSKLRNAVVNWLAKASDFIFLHGDLILPHAVSVEKTNKREEMSTNYPETNPD
jgi:hypothetical protein